MQSYENFSIIFLWIKWLYRKKNPEENESSKIILLILHFKGALHFEGAINHSVNYSFWWVKIDGKTSSSYFPIYNYSEINAWSVVK